VLMWLQRLQQFCSQHDLLVRRHKHAFSDEGGEYATMLECESDAKTLSANYVSEIGLSRNGREERLVVIVILRLERRLDQLADELSQRLMLRAPVSFHEESAEIDV